jgi:hypothetical protein
MNDSGSETDDGRPPTDTSLFDSFRNKKHPKFLVRKNATKIPISDTQESETKTKKRPKAGVANVVKKSKPTTESIDINEDVRISWTFEIEDSLIRQFHIESKEAGNTASETSLKPGAWIRISQYLSQHFLMGGHVNKVSC